MHGKHEWRSEIFEHVLFHTKVFVQTAAVSDYMFFAAMQACRTFLHGDTNVAMDISDCRFASLVLYYKGTLVFFLLEEALKVFFNERDVI